MTLRRDRDALSDDIRMLRGWLDDQRGRMRTTAAQLQLLADDPSALRDVEPPEASEDDDDVVVDVNGHGSSDDDGFPTEAVPALGGSLFDDEGSEREASNDPVR